MLWGCWFICVKKITERHSRAQVGFLLAEMHQTGNRVTVILTVGFQMLVWERSALLGLGSEGDGWFYVSFPAFV